MVDAPSIARRCLCLHSVIARAALENNFQEYLLLNRSAPDKEKTTAYEEHSAHRDELVHWLQSEELWEALSAHERTEMQRPFGTWGPDANMRFSWRVEAYGVMAWAIGLHQRILPYDHDHWPEIPLPVLAATQSFVASSRLCSEEEVSQARDVAELWLWRARTARIQQEPQKYEPPVGTTYTEIIARTARRAQQQQIFEPIEDDFPALGKAYSQASDNELSWLNSIATERLYGLNWICEFSSDWDDVPTDT